MPLFDKMPSLMPVVITQDVWQCAVDFPDEPEQMEERLSNLLLSALLTLRTAGPAREKIIFTMYCQPPRADIKAPVSLPLYLTRASHHFLISLASQA
ncbi:hypothetical protein EHN07_03800 [Buttiauxella warmboldiae]|uniref:Uncharacterized protein n=1 Tax=Buttiauxella warmboldiae TaxID=82993 RepID=A0A3N5EEF9_9ENTR|nr:hypothetical protein [Buttiauxella warmboldiae]RPH30236.1 hypothetical protein EHN07_03800 [Buttiauxella warmboldiae]